MKKTTATLIFILLITLSLINTQNAVSQVLISGSSGTPDNSAMLEIKSTDKGLLIPRMNTTQRTSIDNGTGEPTKGLLVYDTDLKSFFLYGVTAKGSNGWINLSGSAEIWKQSGNNVYLSNSAYNVGIGTSTPSRRLVIRADNDNDTLMEIQDKDGNPIMIVTPTLTKFNFKEGAKGISGGFAVGRYALAKGNKAITKASLLEITTDSTRIYTSAKAGISGGFAVGRYALAKGGKSYIKKYFFTDYDSTRVYTDGSGTKGVSGGFAVGRYALAKGSTQNYNFFTDIDSTRVFTGGLTKGVSGGFAVGRYALAKGSSGNYMYMVPDNYFIGDQSGDSLQTGNYTGKYNTFFGFKTGLTDTSGTRNVLLGYEAGTAITSGSDNVMLGYQAGYSVTSASNNISLGTQAGFNNDSASNNIFIGNRAGFNHIESPGIFAADNNIYLGNNAGYGASGQDTSSSNIFIGNQAGFAIEGGSTNVFLGNQAGMSTTTASQNVFLGNNAGISNVSGEANVFLGDFCGESNETGSYNVLLGRQAGDSLIDGQLNVFIGDLTGHDIKHGEGNTFIGTDAGGSALAGNHNIFMGANAGFFHKLGDDNVYLGNNAGAGKDTYTGTNQRNVVLGANAGTFMDDAIDNIFIGHKAGEGSVTDSVTGDFNVIIGERAGSNISDGEKNVFLGTQCGFTNSIGKNNVFIGNKAGYKNQGSILGSDTTGSSNVFLGTSAGYNNINGYNNVFLGFEAGYKNTGDGNFQSGDLNVFMGANAGHENTIGYQNTIIGNAAGYSNMEGNINTFIGTFAGNSNENGDGNICIGAEAGTGNVNADGNIYIGSQTGTITDVQQNTIIGNYAGKSLKGSYNTIIGYSSGGNAGSKNVFIGYTTGSSETGSNKLYIDNSDTATPLIYGEFDNDYLQINSNLNINGKYTFPNVDGTSDQVLKTDGAGNLSWTSVSAIDATTASNGLTMATNDVQLGGTLTKATNIDQNSNNFSFSGTGNIGIGTTTPGYKLHVINSETTNDDPAIYGEHNVSDYYGIGVQGVGRYVGVKGVVNSGAVSGSDVMGILGDASGDSDETRGVHGRATGTKINYGVSGYASGGTINWGGYFVGDLYASGQTGIGTNAPAANTKLHVLLSGSALGSQYAGTVACFQQNSSTTDWGRISIISGTDGNSIIDFGDADSQNVGGIRYSNQYNMMLLRTNAADRVTIDNSGNVNILTGELNRSSVTGAANLVPIAYGNVSYSGTSAANSGNISINKTGTGTYEITITGESYYYSDYITNVTLISGNSYTATAGSVNSHLLIHTRDASGADVDAGFMFTVYKP